MTDSREALSALNHLRIRRRLLVSAFSIVRLPQRLKHRGLRAYPPGLGQPLGQAVDFWIGEVKRHIGKMRQAAATFKPGNTSSIARQTQNEIARRQN